MIPAGGGPDPEAARLCEDARAAVRSVDRVLRPSEAEIAAACERLTPGDRALMQVLGWALGQLGAEPAPAAPAASAGTEPAGAARIVRARVAHAARVGAPYEARVEAPEGFRADRAVGHEAAGLGFDPGTLVFRGEPHAHGSFAVAIHGRLGDEAIELRLEIPVSPDPWSLWKDLPSPRDAPFWKPDSDCGRLEGELLLLHASRRGRRHANVGGHRDDDARVARDAATGWHVAVVADGAGSAELSREGSRIAVGTAAGLLPGTLARDVTPVLGSGDEARIREALLAAMTDAAFRAMERIEAAALAAGRMPRDFSTTLILGAARRLGDGRWLAAGFSVGDGLAALWNAPAREVRAMMRADSGEFAGQTQFLARSLFDDPAALAGRLAVAITPGFTAFALMTDGVSDAKFPTKVAEADPAVWDRVWREEIAPALAAGDVAGGAPESGLLDWLDFRVAGEHDDRSIALMLAPGYGDDGRADAGHPVPAGPTGGGTR